MFSQSSEAHENHFKHANYWDISGVKPPMVSPRPPRVSVSIKYFVISNISHYSSRINIMSSLKELSLGIQCCQIGLTLGLSADKSCHQSRLSAHTHAAVTAIVPEQKSEVFMALVSREKT